MNRFIIDLYNFVLKRIEYVKESQQEIISFQKKLVKEEKDLKEKYDIFILWKNRYTSTDRLQKKFDTMIYSYNRVFSISDERITLFPSNKRYGWNEHHSHPQT
jgi:hypothetical protein